MPFMAAMPNRATKPMAAEMLNGMSARNSASMPPISAIGMALPASRVSRNEPKLAKSSSRISAMAIGTAIASRCSAFLRLPNSPTHSTR